MNEAAHALGIPVGTVKARVYYALRALRLVLAERAVTEPASYFDLKKAPITNRRLRFSEGSN